MPVCRRCRVSFPNSAQVEGKTRNLQNRVYCLACSPFGRHNTRKVETARCEECVVCDGQNGIKGSVCRYCTNKIARWRLKLACIALKGSKCERCGWQGNPVALDFHHENPAHKEHGLNMATRSWASLRRELEKCELLCTRCHRLEHARELPEEFWRQVFNYRGKLRFGGAANWPFLDGKNGDGRDGSAKI